MEFLGWLESLSYSVWVRESPSLWAFPALLFVHTLGMSLVAGGSAVISMALLGFWPKTAIKPLERLFPVMWFGFAINLFTGVSIFLKDASIYGRNYDLYVKLVFVVAGVALISITRKQVFADPGLDTASRVQPGEDACLGIARLLVLRHRLRATDRVRRTRPGALGVGLWALGSALHYSGAVEVEPRNVLKVPGVQGPELR